MKRIATVLLTLSFATVAGAALADANVQVKDFKTLDADHDGKISGGEAQAENSLSEGFLQADRNKDGSLTQQEYSSWLKTLKASQAEHK